MNDVSDTVVLSPFFEPTSAKDFEEKPNTNEGGKEALTSQAEDNFAVNNAEKVSDTADHIVRSPFFQHCWSSENEEENGPNGSISEDKIEENMQSPKSEQMSDTTKSIPSPFSKLNSSDESEDKMSMDVAVYENKSGSSSSQSKENFKIHSGKMSPRLVTPSPFFCHRLSSDIPVKIEREEQLDVKFTSRKDKNEFCSSQDEEKLKRKNSGEASDIAEQVYHSSFFCCSISSDVVVKKESKVKPTVKLIGGQVESELSISQDEEELEVRNSDKINDIIDPIICNRSLSCNLLNNTAVTKQSGRKTNVKCTSEDVNNSSSSPAEQYSKMENSGKVNNSTDSVIPSPFFNASQSSESVESKDEQNVKLTNRERENKSWNEPEVGIKVVTKNSRKLRKRHSTVKKDAGRKKVVTSPYFAEEADWPLPDEDSAKSGDKQRKGKKWIPPRSPYALIQEDLFDKPWQLLIATIFLTKTRGQLAIPYIHKFLEKWPTPESLLQANFEQVHEIFQPLGLGMVRSCSVFRFTKEFLEKDWRYPIELHGIGKYGNDSYRMFCVNEWREVNPTDIPLSMYREWLTANQEKLCLK